MERPLPASDPHTAQLAALARSLLYCEQTEDGHLAVLREAFGGVPSERRLLSVARRTLRWTAHRPQPRVKALTGLLRHEERLRRLCARYAFQPKQVPVPAVVRPLPGMESWPALDTARALSRWFGLAPQELAWFADLRDWNHASGVRLQHYTYRVQPKPSGGVRLLERPRPFLKKLQRQVYALLSRVPLHHAVHGFRKGRSIVSFAEPHAAKAAVLRMDLENFFVSVSGPRVQALFRTLGFPEAVADLLGGVCTCTTPPGVWTSAEPVVGQGERRRLQELYARPHLPQGAPSSPALANLCAFRLDRRLHGLAREAGAVYTRYADDLAFSGDAAFARAAFRFSVQVGAIAAEEGFSVHHRKTRLMRRSVRQRLAGLTVNSRPNLCRREMEQLEATLFNCVRHGAESQNRAGHADFRRYLEGRVSFAAMVNRERAAKLERLLQQIAW